MSLTESSEALAPSPLLRSYSPDDLAPEAADAPSAPRGEFELVLGPKHLLAILALLLTQMGLVAGIAYTAGRAAATVPPNPAQPRAAAAAVPASPKPSITPEAAPPAPVKPPTALPVSNDLTPGRPPAGLYLQVAAVDLASAKKMAAELGAKGFSARLTPGIGEQIYRVLVGPAEGGEKALAASLQEAGFASFPKRY
jgi:cell division septation protein DedD